MSDKINNDQPRHVSIPNVIEKIKSEIELRPMEVVEGDLISEKYHFNSHICLLY